jgi:N-acetylglucosamine-6-phosphate deacetylase
MRSISGRDPQSGQPIEVSIEAGRIASIRKTADGDSVWLSSGLIDLQINGYQGHDLNSGHLTIETVLSLARSILATGVTTFLPTLITASEESLLHSLSVIAEARRLHPVLAHMIPGVHLEGPHISPLDGFRGAHPQQHIRPPSLAEFDRWQSASGGLVRLVTLSPHDSASLAYIAALHARGVRVSIGHTHCTAQQIHAAASAGAALSTHLGNGIADPLPRHPNILWAQLAEDRLTATFIADGHHLPTDTLAVMLRAKTLQRSILVSDAVALAGMPPGRYKTPIGGEVELSPEGRLSLVDSPFLAGAVLPLKDGVANIMRSLGLPLADALRLASENPGRLIADKSVPRGTLQIGADADLIRFNITGDGSFEIESALVHGEPWH